jgi:nucleoside-diphosphate-sugar epimerase
MRILIAGCGDVGRHLGIRLQAAGHQVWGLRRDCSSLPDTIGKIDADLRDPDTLDALPRSLDLVYYTASTSGDRSEAGYRRTYVAGLRNVVDACLSQGSPLKRVFFSSSTSVYGQTAGEDVTETSPTLPERYSGSVMLEAEQLLTELKVPGTSVRFGGIYGPGRTYMIRIVVDGSARLKSSEDRFTNRIHRDDCAGFLAHLSTLRDPAPLYLGVDNDPAAYNDVIRFIARGLGQAMPAVSEAPHHDAMRGRSNKRCRNDRLRATGYSLMYPSFRQGYAPLIADQLASKD